MHADCDALQIVAISLMHCQTMAFNIDEQAALCNSGIGQFSMTLVSHLSWLPSQVVTGPHQLSLSPPVGAQTF